MLSSYGPFEELELNLTPLTIITGPNAVGKSFLMRAVYAMLAPCRDVTPSPHPKRPSLVLGLPERFVGFPLGRAHIIIQRLHPWGITFSAGGARLPRLAD